MSERTLRRRAASIGLELVKARYGRLYLLMRGNHVVALAASATELSELLGARAAA